MTFAVIFGKRIENQRILYLFNHLDLLDAALLNDAHLVTYLSAGFDDYLAAFGIDNRPDRPHLRRQLRRGNILRLVEQPYYLFRAAEFF